VFVLKIFINGRFGGTNAVGQLSESELFEAQLMNEENALFDGFSPQFGRFRVFHEQFLIHSNLNRQFHFA
jgi:hypothetical protein